jgi:hypothetical protein
LARCPSAHLHSQRSFAAQLNEPPSAFHASVVRRGSRILNETLREAEAVVNVFEQFDPHDG